MKHSNKPAFSHLQSAYAYIQLHPSIAVIPQNVFTANLHPQNAIILHDHSIPTLRSAVSQSPQNDYTSWWWLIPRTWGLLGRLVVNWPCMLLGGCGVRFLMRTPYGTSDRRRHITIQNYLHLLSEQMCLWTLCEWGNRMQIVWLLFSRQNGTPGKIFLQCFTVRNCGLLFVSLEPFISMLHWCHRIGTGPSNQWCMESTPSKLFYFVQLYLQWQNLTESAVMTTKGLRHQHQGMLYILNWSAFPATAEATTVS